MLGRRAAVVGSVVVLAVGGGAAFAAAHGDSPSKKPAPASSLVPQQKVELRKLERSQRGQGEHHCKHESNVSPADV
jgi:hypothetical protein